MDTDRLHKAIRDWFEASAAYDKALGEYEGYSWGWAGQYEIENRQKAAEEFETALNEVVDKRVRVAVDEILKG